MPRSTSLGRRVAWGSALAASAAALLAACATSLLASYLVQRAEDRRLKEAAVTFAGELDHGPIDAETITKVYLDESKELEHAGVLFAVYDRSGQWLVGERRLRPIGLNGDCINAAADTLRICQVLSSKRLISVAGSAHTTLLPTFAPATLLAAALAAALAWIASRPISRYVIGPLSRLQSRVAQLEVHAFSQADLGKTENIVEVDALRETIAQAVGRVEQALAQAHRFAANAAHELRTPLTAVHAELELLSESLADSGQCSDILRAQQKLAELGELVDRLLILSVPTRVSTDAYELVSLRDLFEDTVEALPFADRHRVVTSEEDAAVTGDTVLLNTMIANAIANGLKFGDQVVVKLARSDRYAVIHVDDDGPGIDAAERERAFEPFFRSSDALRRRLPGHGLGLALIQHIAQTHGGSASFVDKHKHGARLEIRLPVSETGG